MDEPLEPPGNDTRGRAVSAALPIPVIQLLQVLTVALGAPGVTGVIAKVEARLQGRRGPRVLQPYYDLAKLFRKEALAPGAASWFFLAAPLIAVAAYLTIPLLIPVLTSYGLPLGLHGRHPGRRVPAVAGQLRRRHRRAGDRQPVRAARVEPGQDVLGDHRAGGAVRGVHRGAADRHRPAVRAGRDGPVQRRAGDPPGAPAGVAPRCSW